PRRGWRRSPSTTGGTGSDPTRRGRRAPPLPHRSRSAASWAGSPGSTTRTDLPWTHDRSPEPAPGDVLSSRAPRRRPQRPVFDPNLPGRLRRRLEARPEALIPRSRTPDPERRKGDPRWYGAAVGALALSCTAAYLTGQAPDAAALGFRCLSTAGLSALVWWGFRRGGRFGGVFSLLLAWGPLFLIWAASEDVAVTGANAFFWSAGPLGTLALALKGTPALAVRHFDSYLIPEDFHHEEAALLARLQTAIDEARQAHGVLGDQLESER